MHDPDLYSTLEHELPTTRLYGISTYRSQLVLVGGLDPSTQQATNKVWVSDDGSKWEPSLPPLPTVHDYPMVVNTGSLEYLTVIGGCVQFKDGGTNVEVLVLIGEQWMSAHPIPLLSSQPPLFSRPRRRGIDCIAHTIHDKNLFILRGWSSSLYCKLDSLLATANFESTSSPPESVWKEFAVPSSSHYLHSLGNHVIAAGNIDPRELGPRMSVHLCGTAQAQLSQMINVTPKIIMCILPCYSDLDPSWRYSIQPPALRLQWTAICPCIADLPHRRDGGSVTWRWSTAYIKGISEE